MSKKMLCAVLFLVWLAGPCFPNDLVPVAVSPGASGRTVIVRESCPTFSWTAVPWALAYEVVVFEAAGDEVPPYERLAGTTAPVLVKEIPGQALSWTPSADERLTDGRDYLWYVGAMLNSAQGSWSEGRRFLVYEDRVGAEKGELTNAWMNREKELEADASRESRPGMKTDAVEKAIANFELTSDSRLEPQGSEGATNTFYGLAAGASTTGTNNSFFGRTVGYVNTTGSNNTFMGYLAGRNNTASENTFVGYLAGNANTTGYWNAFLGDRAGSANAGGYQNTFLGSVAGKANTTGYSNTFLGRCSGMSNTTGFENTFAGIAAGQYNTTGKRNAFLGGFSGYKNTTGYQNTFLGSTAGYFNSTGYQNTFLGESAGYKNTTGSSNTFIGRAAGHDITTGNENTFLGTAAGRFNVTGTGNVFVGKEAGYKSTGSDNTFLGYHAGHDITTGNENTFLGAAAGRFNVIGMGNVFVGKEAGYYGTGSHNTFLGYHGGLDTTTGECNTFLGSMAGRFNVTGMRNVFLGYEAGYNETGSDLLYIANSDTSSPLIYGDFSSSILSFNGKVGIQTIPTTYKLEISGGAYCDGGAWVDGSSREYKENISGLSAGDAWAALSGLEPVAFNYKENKKETYLGFIAEDVPDLVAMNDRKGLNPMDVVAVLTKVVQEQQKAIAELRAEVARLKAAEKGEEIHGRRSGEK